MNWQPRNSLAHVARGSDGAMFFQWRASRSGAEKFHSAMVPHAGTDSAHWRDVVALGADLDALAQVAGTTVELDVALVHDWASWWALQQEFRPTVDLTWRERLASTYEALWDLGRTVSVVPARPSVTPPGSAGLGAHPVVVLPQLYLVSDEARDALRAYVEGGGHLVVPCFSGIVDEREAAPDGPHPGQLRDVLGLVVEEFHPLREGEAVSLAAGDAANDDGDAAWRGRFWSERVEPRGARVLRTFTDGPDPATPPSCDTTSAPAPPGTSRRPSTLGV